MAASGSAGTGYVVAPESGHGPGILVLHSWWGLTPFFREVCDRLADAGFVALAPDLHGDDRTESIHHTAGFLAQFWGGGTAEYSGRVR